MATKPKKLPGSTPVVRRAKPEREIVAHALWPAGLYVAPWLNGHEGLAIIAIDAVQRLVGILDVTAGNAHYNAYLNLEQDDAATELSFDDVELFSDANALKSMGSFWVPGVHRAPWGPRTLVGGYTLIVIAPGGGFWDIVECQEGGLGELEATAWESFDRACHEPRVPSGYDYDGHTAVPDDAYDRFCHLEQQYKEDREYYGKLIKEGAAASGADAP